MRHVELSVEGHVATIQLAREDTLNALSTEMLDALGAEIAICESTPDIWAVIVTGVEKAFSAGADIAEISKLKDGRGVPFAKHGQAIFSRLEKLSKPVIAAVSGFALGGGCELALACHLRIATSRARFGQPEVKLGILPGFGGTQRLPRLVGRAIATELILSGRIIKAEEALRIGLVNEVVEPPALLTRAREIVDSFLPNGPGALATSLQAIDAGLEGSLEAGLTLEAKLFGAMCDTDEMREGTQAFLERRPPRFR